MTFTWFVSLVISQSKSATHPRSEPPAMNRDFAIRRITASQYAISGLSFQRCRTLALRLSVSAEMRGKAPQFPFQAFKKS